MSGTLIISPTSGIIQTEKHKPKLLINNYYIADTSEKEIKTNHFKVISIPSNGVLIDKTGVLINS